jgi:signal transduction histidine kinase/pSer/pThr/pTyr-binding forkhead associated (FHA) protein
VPSLFVIRGNDQGARFELEEATVGLGRDPANGVQLHDTEVSRQHAQLRREASDYVLVDLGSSNGSFVNGKRVQSHRLSSGDHIQLGGTLMLYTGPAEQPEEDLAGKIDISSQPAPDEQSHIVHSVTQAEGTRPFDLQGQLPRTSWLTLARSNFQAMYHAALAVSRTLDIDQLLHRIMDVIFEAVDPDRGCLMLLDQETKKLVPKVRRTRKGARPADKITISKTILDYVLEKNEGVLTTDARDDQRWDPAASIVQLGIREAICVPMQGRYDVVGIIYVDTSRSPQEVIQQGRAAKFSEDHLKLTVAIAHQAALAVEDTRYYSAMVQAERLAAVGQTIATVSHHIKNILQGVRGGSYLIEMGLAEHDEGLVRKGWNIVEKNQAKISNLVMDMLTFSKEREPDLAPADLNRVVGDVVELMQSRAAEEEVELLWHPAPDMPTLVFDSEAIHRAVLNVVTNAIDAAGQGPQPGHVEVSTEYASDGSPVRVVVRDNGPGIPSGQVESLFSPFVSTKKSRGTGLGLPVSEKILKEHGGRIRVQSTPGQGACFTLELPALAAESPQPPVTGRHSTGSSRVATGG